jgi:hypothetical protein
VDPLIYGVPIKAAEVPTHQRLLKGRCEAARASLGSIVADRFLWTSILATANCLLGTNFRSVKGSGPGRLGPKEWDRVMPRSLMDGLRQFFGQQSSRADAARQPKPSSPSPRRYMTRIGVVLAIEAPHPGPHGATVFVQRLGSPVTAFDYQMQFPTEGPGTFLLSGPTVTSGAEDDAVHGFSARGWAQSGVGTEIVLGLVGERTGRRNQPVTSDKAPWPCFS